MHNPQEKYYERAIVSSGKRRSTNSGRNSVISDNLALDYEIFTEGNGFHSNNSNSIYGRSLSEMEHVQDILKQNSVGKQNSAIKQSNVKQYNIKQKHNNMKQNSIMRSAMLKQASPRSYSNSGKYKGKINKNIYNKTYFFFNFTEKHLHPEIQEQECTEALSVKKSAEIAALFADVKLSQTTDIRHLISRPRSDKGSVSSRGTYCTIVPPEKFSRCPSRNERFVSNRMITNTLYSGVNISRNNMYSARNGLYTIQSQSDESRRSSVSESKKSQIKNKEGSGCDAVFKGLNVSESLESTLGYLP